MEEEKARKVTYGAMMIGLFVVLLAVSLYVPLIGALAMFFIPLPIILYRIKYNRTASIFVMMTGIVLSMFVGGIVLIPFGFLYGLLGLIIGDTIATKKSKLYTFMATGTTLLILTITSYVAAIVVFKVNFIDAIMDGARASQKQVITFFEKSGELPEGFEEQLGASLTLTEISFPSTFIIFTFILAFIFVSLNLLIVKRLGNDVKSFPPFQDMKLPLITVWYYLVVMLWGLFFEMKIGTTSFLIYTNASIILRFMFFLQGVSFINYSLKEMKLPKWAIVILTLFAFPLYPITVLLGVLDTGLNVRAWIGKNKAK
ncbi:YybS family protein [Sporosarcina sp. G11-34]|uniref:YybS family protein n=1 Tax=Sporosarcina sp. G11-34 TaxID=2849605 RepID=UPI0022A9639F|nr:DUF2232 domain-containing protein [Sporosarcina sp. G11-34]MCZ2259050.1 YybS family protein [Sporosarcina sp. G11-34]